MENSQRPSSLPSIMNSQRTEVSKKATDFDAQTRAAQWVFVCAFVLVLTLFLASWLFHFSEAWRRIIKTGMPLLVFFGLLLIQCTKRRNAKAIQQKLDKLEQEIKGRLNN
jgi:low affinity Fe/Cu permease